VVQGVIGAVQSVLLAPGIRGVPLAPGIDGVVWGVLLVPGIVVDPWGDTAALGVTAHLGAPGGGIKRDGDPGTQILALNPPLFASLVSLRVSILLTRLLRPAHSIYKADIIIHINL